MAPSSIYFYAGDAYDDILFWLGLEQELRHERKGQ